MSLYHDMRPKSLKEVVGQVTAVQVLRSKFESKTLPNVVLFVGPTGTGKTTLARICVSETGCTNNLVEQNCADVRGIDSVREIHASLPYRGIDGGNKAWILDEVVQLPKTTQQAFLKELEDGPPHAYFFLCTTSTEGLLPTFLGRCFVINLKLLTDSQIKMVLSRATLESLSNKVVSAIVESASGSARRALQLLEAVLAVEGEEYQLQAIELSSEEREREVEFLAKALLRRASWRELQPILQKITTKDVEGLRWQILEYVSKVMLFKDQGMCKLIITAFESSFASSGRAGLFAAVWSCCQNK
jgi:DNA polymerase III gamma/tau subunit